MASTNTKILAEIIDFSKVTPHSLIVITDEETKAVEIIQQLMEPDFECPDKAKGTPILLLRPGEKLELVSELEMNKAGWFRL